MRFFQRKVILALIGALIIGGGSGLVEYFVVLHPAQAIVTANNSTIMQVVTATPVPANGSTPVLGGPSSTSTPTNIPTGGNGQSVDLTGSIQSVGTRSFVLATRTGNVTVLVTSQTLYSGSARSFTALQVGLSAEVQGTLTGTNLFATEVNAQNNN